MSTPSQVAAELFTLAAAVSGAVHATTMQYTAELQAQVQRNASGRPGPNAPTGDYRRSISRRTEKAPTGSVGQVGTNKPQGRRLEFGFAGTDSLGRTYNQPAYPHFGPALDVVAPKYEAAIAALGLPPAGDRGLTRTRRAGEVWA